MDNGMSDEQIEEMLNKIRSLHNLMMNDFETLIKRVLMLRIKHLQDESSINRPPISTVFPETNLPKVLQVKDIQKYLGIGRVQAYQLVKSEQFHIVKVGRKILVLREVFLNWLGNYKKD
ncbi:MAG: helix-turn-helix protein [Paenibacillaceae bacterium]|nr:helix-turn-helix protein [Paenibacillaceae bacterium]